MEEEKKERRKEETKGREGKTKKESNE
jgi:hypothetical protein